MLKNVREILLFEQHITNKSRKEPQETYIPKLHQSNSHRTGAQVLNFQHYQMVTTDNLFVTAPILGHYKRCPKIIFTP